MSATFSGLTIGMFSLGLSGLERKIKLGDKRAEKIYKIRKNGNFLLCTLLLGNVAINSAVSVVMSEIASGLVAGIVSTGLIFLFGEVIPQATFSRYAFEFGARTTWLVRIFMVIMWPIAKPMSMVLDFIFGKELPELFDKQELEVLLGDHVGGNKIDSDENRIMLGAMKFSDKTAVDVITPITLNKIMDEHYSRIPIYKDNRDNIIGILYAKDLIVYEKSMRKTVEDLCRKTNLLFVEENHKLDSLLNHFVKNKTHMSFVFNKFHALIGIVTLEDIVEEILKIEILDENDTVADMQHYAQNHNKRTLTNETEPTK